MLTWILVGILENPIMKTNELDICYKKVYDASRVDIGIFLSAWAVLQLIGLNLPVDDLLDIHFTF